MNANERQLVPIDANGCKWNARMILASIIKTASLAGRAVMVAIFLTAK